MIKDLRLKNKKEYFKSINHCSLIINRKSKGFTLIELLTVIGIIGILAGLLMANFIGVRQRARDGVRKSDLRQIQIALELYRSDQGGYPNPSLPNCGSSLRNPLNTITYIEKIPCDPLTIARYTYSSNGTTYSFIACLENTSDIQKDPSNVAPCNGTTRVSYTLRNP